MDNYCSVHNEKNRIRGNKIKSANKTKLQMIKVLIQKEKKENINTTCLIFFFLVLHHSYITPYTHTKKLSSSVSLFFFFSSYSFHVIFLLYKYISFLFTLYSLQFSPSSRRQSDGRSGFYCLLIAYVCVYAHTILLQQCSS